MFRLAAFLFCLILLFSVSACVPSERGETPGPGQGEEPDTQEPEPQDPDPQEPDGQSPAEDEFVFSYDTSYIPDLFDAASATYTVEKLGEGVHLVKNQFTLKNGNVCVVYATEVDLTKADIVAGTAGNKTWGYSWNKAVPYAQSQAWEEDNAGRTVLASVNADFFGSFSVNAFVKDGVILKASHNDNGSYDYTDLSADVPASAPMLFGISGETAQIAPIVNYTGDPTSAQVKQQLVQASLSYTAVFSDHWSEHTVSVGGTLSTSSLLFLSQGSCSAAAGSIVLKLELGAVGSLAIAEKQTLSAAQTVTAGDGYGYLIMHPDYEGNKSALRQAEAGDTVALTVASPDGLWNGYDTILGCRQALVTDGAVASTVTLENSNGAQSAGVPRTAVGIKKDGTVVVFAAEGLRYGGKSQSSDDPYGLNLPQLAQFIRFYGCVNAANFDGGGSTQLIVEGENGKEVRVRSSDTGSAELASSRAVMNTLLVTTK